MMFLNIKIRNNTVPVSADVTVPVSADVTVPVSADVTVPVSADDVSEHKDQKQHSSC